MDNDFLPKGFTELINETNPKPTILGITEMDPLGYCMFRNLILKCLNIHKNYDNLLGYLKNILLKRTCETDLYLKNFPQNAV